MVISKTELEEDMKSMGAKFTNWKTKQAMEAADTNGDGIINSGLELKGVLEYA